MGIIEQGTSITPQPEDDRHDLLALENVPSIGDVVSVDPSQEPHQETPLDKQAFFCLLIQHLSK